MSNSNKHEFYFELNLIGYGLAKFNDDFLKEFGFTTKTDFYKYCVEIGVADTIGTVKNRMDTFDPYFPQSGRAGWWQSKERYIHRKELIDSLFGEANVQEYANNVKLYLIKNKQIQADPIKIQPIITSRFKKLQETGLEAELYFMHHFKKIEAYQNATLEDARLYGDGYDFQLNVNEQDYLIEVKGIREKQGYFRLTEKEFLMAAEYKNDYHINLVLNMNENPTIVTIENPVNNLKFNEMIVNSKETKEYHLAQPIS